MFIVDDDRGFIINVDNITTIELEDTMVIATANNGKYILGKYKTTGRAKEVFQELLDKCFPEPPEPVFEDYAASLDSCIVSGDAVYREPLFKDETICGCELVYNPYAAYYMPEE